MTVFAAASQGFGLGLGLIIAIGAQNAFVIRQGVIGRCVFAVATVCFLTDAALIVAGAAGLGSVIAETPWLRQAAAWGGAAFLVFYGVQAAKNVIRAREFDWDAGPKAGGLKAAVLTALALSWLNPHVYLDTVVMLGGVAAQVDGGARLWFAGGAVLASFLWFYGLAAGAQAAAPFFRGKTGMRLLDGIVALVMFMIAATLIWGEVGHADAS